MSPAGRGLARKEGNMKSPTMEAEWRCRKCGTLLGIERTGRVHIKHKRAQFVVRGHVMAVCPRCAELNELDNGRAAEEPRPAA